MEMLHTYTYKYTRYKLYLHIYLDTPINAHSNSQELRIYILLLISNYTTMLEWWRPRNKTN